MKSVGTCLRRQAASASLTSMKGPAPAVAASERSTCPLATKGSPKESRRPVASSSAEPTSPHSVNPARNVKQIGTSAIIFTIRLP